MPASEFLLEGLAVVRWRAWCAWCARGAKIGRDAAATAINQPRHWIAASTRGFVRERRKREFALFDAATEQVLR